MIGCLTAPFRALGCLVVVGALWRSAGSTATRWAHRARGGSPGAEAPAAATSAGRPGPKALASAKSKVDSLNGWGADRWC